MYISWCDATNSRIPCRQGVQKTKKQRQVNQKDSTQVKTEDDEKSVESVEGSNTPTCSGYDPSECRNKTRAPRSGTPMKCSIVA